MAVQSCLRSHMPAAGFRHADTLLLLRHPRRDHQVLIALAAAGYTTPYEIEHALAHMFREAESLVVADDHWVAKAPPEGSERRSRILVRMATYEFVGDLLWPTVPFGKMGGLDEDIFVELFMELLHARREWWSHPCPPFDLSEHVMLARAIDNFDLATGDDWKHDNIDDEMFALANSQITTVAHDVSDEEDEDEDDGQDGMGIETDVAMREAEEIQVRDVCERLACTKLLDKKDTEMELE